MFSSRKFVQYVHNDGCGCHKVPRLPLNTVNVSCMQTEGVELCTKLGAFTVVSGRVAFYLPVQKFNLFSYRIYILKIIESVKRPYSDSASSDTLVLCSSGSVCKMLCTEDTQIWRVQDNASYQSDVHLLLCLLTTLYLLVL